MKQKFTSNGWLVVNKPEGVESFGVIRKLKFRYQFHKIGFAGTLDPLASGILLIGINKATKLIPKIHLFNKSYEVAQILELKSEYKNVKTLFERETLQDTDG